MSAIMHLLNRLALVAAFVAVSFVSDRRLDAATVSFTGNDFIFTNGVNTRSGTLTDRGSVGFNVTTTISGMNDAGQTGDVSADNSAFAFPVLANTAARLGIIDQRGAGGGDWIVQQTFTFDQPLDNLSIFGDVNVLPPATTDYENWRLDWVGSSNTAGFTNSPPGDPGLWSVGAGSAKLADGTYTSGTPWRFDNNAIQDQVLLIDPFSFSMELPDGVTELSVFFFAHDAKEGIALFNESFGIDFSAVTVVPEPSAYALVAMGLCGFAARRRRTRR